MAQTVRNFFSERRSQVLGRHAKQAFRSGLKLGSKDDLEAGGGNRVFKQSEHPLRSPRRVEGGEHVLAKAVDRFVDLATTDPKVNYSRGGRHPINDATLSFSKRAALEFISAATGGPYSYSGKALREIHAGMQISDEEFDAIMANFRRALEENGVAQEMVQLAVGMVNATRSVIVEIC